MFPDAARSSRYGCLGDCLGWLIAQKNRSVLLEADCDIRVIQELLGHPSAHDDDLHSGLIGFGTYHYKSASGQEGDWFPVGFASRKAAITVYLGVSLEGSTGLLAKSGKHKTGKGCIYIKRLADVDLAVLEELVADSYAGIKRTYG